MRVNMFFVGTMGSAGLIIQVSCSRKLDFRLFLARPSLERYTVADRFRQLRLLHLALDLGNDLARDLNSTLLLHHEFLS